MVRTEGFADLTSDSHINVSVSARRINDLSQRRRLQAGLGGTA